MADAISANFSLSVIEGARLAFGTLFRKFRSSGLSIRFHGGRVGAVGIDFVNVPDDFETMTADWPFVLKIVNPNQYPIAIEGVKAEWKGGLTFYAETSWPVIKMIYPEPTLPDNGDESFPRLIPAGATQIIEMDSMLFLYKRFLFFKKLTKYNKHNYGTGHPKHLRFSVRIRSNQGRTILKS